MPRRNYEQQQVSDEDRAFVRSLVIHEDAAVLAFDKPSGLPVQTRNPDDRTLDRLMAAFETREVLRKPKGMAGIHWNHFVDTVTEDKAAVEHRYVRILERQEFAVQIDDLIHVVLT